MTDKQSFLEKLCAALSERGVSDADMRPYIERFDRFYDRMANESQQTVDALKDVETIADNISAQISERYDEINRFAERTMTLDVVKDDDEDSRSEPEIDAEPTVTTDIAQVTELAQEYEEYELVEQDTELSPALTAESGELDGTEDDGLSEDATRLPDYVEEEKIPNSTMFWVLFGISLPITIPLGLIFLGIFAAAWALLGGTIVASVAALVVLVAGGAALSLVGIVYGIIQLFESVPVGVYEIGLGIIIAGAVMFAGILIYNFAIRLVPVLIKLVWKLFCFTLEKLKKLFNFLRKECAKL